MNRESPEAPVHDGERNSGGDDWQSYRLLVERALAGDHEAAVFGLLERLKKTCDVTLRARILNDLGVLFAETGDNLRACQCFAEAMELDATWATPQENLRLLSEARPGPGSSQSQLTNWRQKRIGIVSLLFNWPSTGGGTVHTAELARFLSRSGYEVQHFVVVYSGWSVGTISEPVDWPVTRVEFRDFEWNRGEIQRRLRKAVDDFQPDSVIITDSWNFKPRLAEALRGYRYFLRLAAQECLCPLNNVRLLLHDNEPPQSCPKHQLATPEACLQCLAHRGRWSGALHQAERKLAGHGEPDYNLSLKSAFANAAGILVVNPLIAELCKPYAQAVHVVPSGFDADRFALTAPPPRSGRSPVRLLFAGLVDEPMKGFAVLHSACSQLWQVRQDFRLLATADPIGRVDDFTEFIGWQSQQCLPEVLAGTDVVICPTIAEEALGRTAVEAMGAGRPVLASRIGGLPFTVLDEATGLLCEPADPADLQRQLVRLLDSHELRERLGQAGRQRFLTHYTWDAILGRHYHKLLGAPVKHR